MNLLFQARTLFLAILLGCSGLLLTAIYIEPFKSMDPCPMCMMQRAVFTVLAAISLIAFIHGPKAIGTKVYAGLLALVSLCGAALASRQLWLQSLPEDRVPACGPGLDYMLEVFPILEVISMAIKGTGDCAKVQWTFLNLSIPGWSLVAFIGIVVLCVWLLFRRHEYQQ